METFYKVATQLHQAGMGEAVQEWYQVADELQAENPDKSYEQLAMGFFADHVEMHASLLGSLGSSLGQLGVNGAAFGDGPSMSLQDFSDQSSGLNKLAQLLRKLEVELGKSESYPFIKIRYDNRMTHNMYRDPNYRARVNELRIQRGEEPVSDEHFDRQADERDNMMEHFRQRIRHTLERTDGRYIPDGFMGMVENKGSWVKDADGHWVPRSELKD